MTTRFKLTDAAATPDISPSIQSYTHTQSTRRNLLTVDTSALATEAFTPDAADDLVAGDAHHVQFVSSQMAAGNVFTSGDTLKMAIQCLEAHTNNNLFLQVFVSVVDAKGTTVQATLRSKAADGTEMATTITNRFHSTTLSAGYTTVLGDRLVVEFSCTGTPAAASGVQGHNCSMRWGGGGAGGDLAENDTDTGATLNPWIEFVTTIIFAPPFKPQLGSADNPRGQIPSISLRTWTARGLASPVVTPPPYVLRQPLYAPRLERSTAVSRMGWTWGNPLTTTLVPPAVQNPFSVYYFPNPIIAGRAVQLGTWTASYTLSLIGQDTFFGPPGMGPDYDYPNPILRKDNVWTRTLTNWYLQTLIGQDALPSRQLDWPNPQIPKWMTNFRTWTWDTIRTTLVGQDSLPFSLDHWPNPLRPIQPALTWLQSLVTTTLAVIVQNPFALLDWPNPLRRVHPHQGFVDWFKQQLIGQDVLPFRLSDWPLPNRAAVHLRGWLDSFKLSLIGQDFLPFRLSDWPNPLRSRSIDALTWLQNLVNTTLVPIIALPFAQLDWPNPQIPNRANDLLRWTQMYLQTLIGQDVLPKRLLDWPNPLRRTHPHQGFLATFLRTLIGADVLPFRQRDWPLPVRKAEQVRGWISQAFQALSVIVVVMPFRQLEWPVPLRWGQLRQRFPFLPQFRPPTTITTVPNARMVAQQTDFPFAYVSKVNCVEPLNLTVEWSFKIYTGSSSFSSGVRVTQTVGEGIIASTSVNVRVTQTVVEVITHA